MGYPRRKVGLRLSLIIIFVLFAVRGIAAISTLSPDRPSDWILAIIFIFVMGMIVYGMFLSFTPNAEVDKRLLETGVQVMGNILRLDKTVGSCEVTYTYREKTYKKIFESIYLPRSSTLTVGSHVNVYLDSDQPESCMVAELSAYQFKQ